MGVSRGREVHVVEQMQRRPWWRAVLRVGVAGVLVGVASVPVSVVVSALTPWHAHGGALAGVQLVVREV